QVRRQGRYEGRECIEVLDLVFAPVAMAKTSSAAIVSVTIIAGEARVVRSSVCGPIRMKSSSSSAHRQTRLAQRAGIDDMGGSIRSREVECTRRQSRRNTDSQLTVCLRQGCTIITKSFAVVLALAS